MRIIDAKKHLTELLSLLKPSVTEKKEAISGISRIYYTIENWAQIQDTLLELKQYGFIADNVQVILGADISFLARTQKLVLDDTAYKRFNVSLLNVKERIIVFIDVVSEFFKEDEAEQINVKLPEGILLSDFEKVIENLDFILNHCQIVYEANDKQAVTINKVDSGSIWLTLDVSPSAVMLIGGMATAAYIAFKKYINLSKSWQDLRIHKVLARNIESSESALEIVRKECVEEVTKDFIEANSIMLGNDESERNEKSNNLYIALDKFSKLYQKDVEVYASLKASRETIALFPEYEESLKLMAKTLKLTAKEGEE